MKRRLVSILVVALVAAACGNDDETTGATGPADSDDGGSATLTVYAGRGEDLVGPLLERFEDETGIRIEVRYGDTAELAATILEEGSNSPADVFFAQDAGALGALAREGRLVALPDDLLGSVREQFRSPDGWWIGVSGRARTVVYNTEMVSEDELPESILDFVDERWRGRIGWAPTNGSFQAFVTALRILEGDDVARQWLEDVRANAPQVYDGNTPIVQAVIDGEVEVGFVNHYYLHRFLAEDPGAPAANYFPVGGDPGSLVNIAGVAVLDTNDAGDAAFRFVEFLLSEASQQYFAAETFEYPLVDGVPAPTGLPALDEIESPVIDLTDLDDLRGTLELLQEVGLV